jgi:hypothetical protein
MQTAQHVVWTLADAQGERLNLTLSCLGNVCRWYKRKPVDNVVFNEGNTAASYNEQRLFLQSGSERSTRLLGGSTFGGTNQIWAHKRGNKDAQMHF